MAEEGSNSTKNSSPLIFIVIIVVLLLAAVGEYIYYHAKTSKMASDLNAAKTSKSKQIRMQDGNVMRMGGPGMQQVTPPAESDQQTQQVAAGTSTATKTKTFNITAGNFYFVPKNISVNVGDKVTFLVINAGGIHNLKIDELGVKTDMIKDGETQSVTFTASKAGSYVYYCGVPGHREKGMWGTLTVK
ncbi:MAG TPA: plastocyanin/azurin family copper-binding protein [Patescibacteria group bacterium]|nr:plastocyanin/azurin family copper-binding protein [Patescibacteria group bacterium]